MEHGGRGLAFAHDLILDRYVAVAFTTFLANSDDTLMIFFLFFPDNMF